MARLTTLFVVLATAVQVFAAPLPVLVPAAALAPAATPNNWARDVPSLRLAVRGQVPGGVTGNAGANSVGDESVVEERGQIPGGVAGNAGVNRDSEVPVEGRGVGGGITGNAGVDSVGDGSAVEGRGVGGGITGNAGVNNVDGDGGITGNCKKSLTGCGRVGAVDVDVAGGIAGNAQP